MRNRVGIVLALLVLAAGTARADELYFGATLSSSPGQPDFVENRPSLIAAYEAQKSWRFSFTSSDYKNDNAGLKLSTQIIGLEKMWVYEMGQNLYLIGAFGPGLFSAKLDDGRNTSSGTAVGVLGTGSFRIYFAKAFLDLAFNYPTAAVTITNCTVDAGYQSAVVGFGFRF